MPIDPRHPREIRADIRSGKFAGITAGLGPGFVQANMAVLPRDDAYDFLLFCQRNPRPCPLIEVTDVGSVEPVGAAAGADLRTDLPRYRIYKDGVLADEVTDVKAFWRDDLEAFLHDHAQPRTHVHHRHPQQLTRRLLSGGDLCRAPLPAVRGPRAVGGVRGRGQSRGQCPDPRPRVPDPAEGPLRGHRDRPDLPLAPRLL